MTDEPISAATGGARLRSAGWSYVSGWLPPEQAVAAVRIQEALDRYAKAADKVRKTKQKRGRHAVGPRKDGERRGEAILKDAGWFRVRGWLPPHHDELAATLLRVAHEHGRHRFDKITDAFPRNPVTNPPNNGVLARASKDRIAKDWFYLDLWLPPSAGAHIKALRGVLHPHRHRGFYPDGAIIWENPRK